MQRHGAHNTMAIAGRGGSMAWPQQRPPRDGNGVGGERRLVTGTAPTVAAHGDGDLSIAIDAHAMRPTT